MSRIVKDSVFTTSAFFAERGMGFIRELVLAGLLGPTYMGLRNAIIMMNNYSSYLYFGMNQEAYRRVAGAYEKRPEYAQMSHKLLASWGFISSMLIALIILAFAFLSHYTLEFKLALVILAFTVPVMINCNPMAYYLMAIGKFKKTSTIEAVKVLIDTLITILLAYQFGFLGAIAGLLIALVVRLVLYRNAFGACGIPFEWDYFIRKFNDFKAMLTDGLRLFVTSISSTIYMQVDSLIAVLMLGPAALGIYGIATTINSLIYGTYGSTIIPAGQRMYKSADDDKKLKRYLDMLSGFSSYLMVFPIALIVFISPFIIGTLIPAFADAIPIIGVLAIASFFNVTLNPITNYVMAKRRENLITSSTLIAAGINIILSLYLISLGYGLMGVCYATAISYFINFMLLITLSKALEWHKILEDLIPLAYLILLLYSWDSGPLIPLLLTLIYMPILYIVFRSRGISGYALSILRDAKRKYFNHWPKSP